MSNAIVMSGGKTLPQLPYEPTFRFDATEGYGINCMSGTYPDCTDTTCHLCCNQRPDSYSSCSLCYSSLRNTGNTTRTFCGQNGVGTLTSTNNHRLWSRKCYANPTTLCQFSNADGGMFQAWNSCMDSGNTQQKCQHPGMYLIQGGYWCYTLPRHSIVFGFHIHCYCSCETRPTILDVPNLGYSGYCVQACCCWSTGCINCYLMTVNGGEIGGVELEDGHSYIVGVRYEPDNCCALCNSARYCGVPHSCCNSGYYINILKDNGEAGYYYCHYPEHCPIQCSSSSTTNDCMSQIGFGAEGHCYTSSSTNIWMCVGNIAYWENCALTPAELNEAMDAYRSKYKINTCHEWSENPVPFTAVRWEGTHLTSGTACQSNSIYEFYLFCNGMAELRTGVWTCDNGQFGQYNCSGTGTNFGAISPRTSYVWCAFCPSTTLYTGYTYINGQIVQNNRLPMGGACSHWASGQLPRARLRTWRSVPSTCFYDCCVESSSGFSSKLTSSTDDAFVCLYMPHSYCALGSTYAAGTYMYVNTNGIISFGSGTNAYSGLTCTNPSINKIYIDAADRSAQYISTIASKK